MMSIKMLLTFALVAICVTMAAAGRRRGPRPQICDVIIGGDAYGEFPCPGDAGCDDRLYTYGNREVRFCDRPPRHGQLPLCQFAINGTVLDSNTNVCGEGTCEELFYEDELSGYQIYQCVPPPPPPRLCSIVAPDGEQLISIRCPRYAECGDAESDLGDGYLALFCPPEEFDDDSSHGRGHGWF